MPPNCINHGEKIYQMHSLMEFTWHLLLTRANNLLRIYISHPQSPTQGMYREKNGIETQLAKEEKKKKSRQMG